MDVMIRDEIKDIINILPDYQKFILNLIIDLLRKNKIDELKERFIIYRISKDKYVVLFEKMIIYFEIKNNKIIITDIRVLESRIFQRLTDIINEGNKLKDKIFNKINKERSIKKEPERKEIKYYYGEQVYRDANLIKSLYKFLEESEKAIRDLLINKYSFSKYSLENVYYAKYKLNKISKDVNKYKELLKI